MTGGVASGSRVKPVQNPVNSREKLEYLKAYGGSASGIGATSQGEMKFVDPDSLGKFIPVAHTSDANSSKLASGSADSSYSELNLKPGEGATSNKQDSLEVASSKTEYDQALAKLDPLTRAAAKQQQIFWELMDKDEDPTVAWKKAILASDPFEQLPPPRFLAAYVIAQNEKLVNQRGVGKLGEQFQQHIVALSNEEEAVRLSQEAARKVGVDDRKSVLKDAKQFVSQQVKDFKDKREDAAWGDAGKNFKDNLLKRNQSLEQVIDVDSKHHDSATSTSSTSPSSSKQSMSAADAIIQSSSDVKQAQSLALQGKLGPEAQKHARADLVTRNLMGDLKTKDPFADWVVKPVDPSRPETGIRTREEFSKIVFQKKVEIELKSANKFPNMAKFYPEWTMPTIHEMRVQLLPKETLQLESRRRITTDELQTQHSGTFRHMMSPFMFKVFMSMIGFCILSYVSLVLWDHHMEFTRGITPPSWFK